MFTEFLEPSAKYGTLFRWFALKHIATKFINLSMIAFLYHQQCVW